MFFFIISIVLLQMNEEMMTQFKLIRMDGDDKLLCVRMTFAGTDKAFSFDYCFHQGVYLYDKITNQR